MANLESILISITAFAMIVLIVYFIAKYNYQTKKLIIESGKDLEFKKKRFPFFEIALTLIGIGIGLVLSIIPKAMELNDEITGLLIGAFILIFGGLGLVLSIFLRKKIDNK